MLYFTFVLALSLNVVTAAKNCAKTPTCGANGYDKSSSGGTSAYAVFSDPSLSNQAACGAKCSADSRCLSFSFGSGSCYLYSVQV
jgi:hypothetical protein